MQYSRVQPCVRPVDAARMAAGPNAIRGSGPKSQARARGTLAKAGSPDPRFDRLCITSHSPCQTLDLLFRFRALGRAGRRFAICPASHEQNPGDAGHLIGERHGGDLGWLVGN